MKKISWIIIIGFIALIGCKTSRNQTDKNGIQDKIKDNIENNNETLFSMRASSCYGECPEFEFEFFNDRTVGLVSRKFLLESGSYTYKLSEIENKNLTDLINSIEWKTLKDRYTTLAQDLPTNEFTIRVEDEIKNVTQEGLSPQSLIQFKTDLLNFIESLNWESK